MLFDTPFTSELDRVGTELIEHRQPVVQAFLAEFILPRIPEQSLSHQYDRKLLRETFFAFEAEICRYSADQENVRARGRSEWRDDYLLPLANELELQPFATISLIATCHRHGLFDTYTKKNLVRPALNSIVADVLHILEAQPIQKTRAAEFIQAGLCRDEQRAVRAAANLSDLECRNAAGLAARTLVLNAIANDDLGLLTVADYPYTSSLLHLHHLLNQEPYQSTVSPAQRCLVQQDVIALQAAFNSGELHLWQEHLLHDRPQGQERLRYKKKRVSAQMLTTLQSAFRVLRGCTDEEAEIIVRLLIDQGLPGIIGWRCNNVDADALAQIEEQRILSMLQRQSQSLQQPYRSNAEHMLKLLRSTFDQTQVQVSFQRLINDYPSSFYRRSLRRRLGLGFQHKLTEEGQRIKALLADSSGLKPGVAKKILHDFITYGCIGLIQSGDWAKAIPAPAYELLTFFKHAFIVNTQSWPQLLRRVNDELELLKLPPLTSQTARAVYNHAPKSPRWHQGSGDRVDQFARTTAKIDSMPRLHRMWNIIPVRLPIVVRDIHGYAISKTLHALLVLDHDSALPIGLWCSATLPTTEHVGLAIYQSIWHPGKPDWILRGLPRTIVMPKALEGIDQTEVTRALNLMEVDLDQDSHDHHWGKKRIVTWLLQEGVAAVHQKYAGRAVTPQQAQDVLLLELHRHAFPTDRPAPIAAHTKRSGLTMPGGAYSAAGLLLPRVGTAIIIQNGVRVGETRYDSLYFTGEQGTETPYRAFPYQYRRIAQAIFVEQNEKIFYLKRSIQSFV